MGNDSSKEKPSAEAALSESGATEKEEEAPKPPQPQEEDPVPAPPLLPVPLRRQSTASGAQPSILLALRQLERDADKLRNAGLSAFTFTLGIANLLLSAFLFGAMGHSFWLVYGVQGLLIIGYRVAKSLERSRTSGVNVMWYFADFCWMCNFLFVASSSILSLEVIAGADGATFSAKYPMFGLLAAVLAVGPLGWSVVVLNNALVLHDINNYSATFIHLWPPWTMLAIRWNRQAVFETYPGHFDGFAILDGVSTWSLFLIGVRFYVVWWAGFTLWMVVWGRFQSPEKTGRDTVYLDLLRSTPAMRSLCGIRKDHVIDDAAKVAPVLKYMTFHAVSIVASFAFGAFCLTFPPEVVHAPFCVFILGVAVFNGGKRYEYYLTQKEIKALKKLIKEEFPEQKQKEKGL